MQGGFTRSVVAWSPRVGSRCGPGVRSARARRWLALSVTLALLALGALRTAAFADALDGALAVRSAYVNFDHGVIELNAQVTYPLNPAIRKALQNGVTLSFDVEARVEQVRRFWFNATVIDVTLHRELAYHVLTRRYVVRDVQSGGERSFADVRQALRYLQSVHNWPILVESQLLSGRYVISVRADVRRGKLPASLRALLFWTDDWQRESPWYSWSLPV